MKVIVVGAGVVGVTTAFYLKADGHEVTVIEQNAVAGSETSFANAGQLCHLTAKPWAAPGVPSMIIREFGKSTAPYLLHLRADPAMWSWLIQFLLNCSPKKYSATKAALLGLAKHSTRLMKDVVKSTNIKFEYESKGILHLYGGKKSFTEAVKTEEKIPEEKSRGEVLDYSDCLAAEPALTQSQVKYAGGILHSYEHTGDAHQFTRAISSFLEQEGVEFLYGLSAEKLLLDGNKVSGVLTSAGIQRGDATVLSAASESVSLLKTVSLKLPVYPIKGYSITIPTAGHNGAPSLSVHDHERKLGFTRLGERLRVAGTAEIGAQDKAATPARIRALREHTQKVFPNAGKMESAQPWAGLRPMTPDGAPIISRTKYNNLFINTGHGSLGWSLSCASGHMISCLVAGRLPVVEPLGFGLERYG